MKAICMLSVQVGQMRNPSVQAAAGLLAHCAASLMPGRIILQFPVHAPAPCSCMSSNMSLRSGSSLSNMSLACCSGDCIPAICCDCANSAAMLGFCSHSNSQTLSTTNCMRPVRPVCLLACSLTGQYQGQYVLCGVLCLAGATLREVPPASE